jgi:hypothetical protein
MPEIVEKAHGKRQCEKKKRQRFHESMSGSHGQSPSGMSEQSRLWYCSFCRLFCQFITPEKVVEPSYRKTPPELTFWALAHGAVIIMGGVKAEGLEVGALLTVVVSGAAKCAARHGEIAWGFRDRVVKIRKQADM